MNQAVLEPSAISLREPVGLVAGWGRFPIVFAEKARSVGLPVVCVGLSGEADPQLAALCPRFHWAGRLGRIIRLFHREGVRRLVWAGKVHKSRRLYHPWRFLQLLLDWRALCWFYRHQRRDNKDDTLLLSLVAEFARDGLTVTSALEL